MAKLELALIPALEDNYIYIIHEAEKNLTAAIDPSEAEPVQRFLDDRGWSLTHILNTHHHWDHVGGNKELVERYGATVVGARIDEQRIPGIKIKMDDGDRFSFGGHEAEVMFAPGHTSGHICYWFRADGLLFVGDTLFSFGCGRLFEGTPGDMWTSLERLRALPDDTLVCSAHEYTLANIRFARTVDPGNALLESAEQEAKRLRAAHRPTLPSRLGLEKAANPFLRADSDAIRQNLGMPTASPSAVFAELRRRKDVFRG